MLDVFLDALIDTLKMLPILYLVYLLVSFFSHNNNEKYRKLLHKTNRFGPLIGATVGSVPQCGFSSAMADLFSRGMISLGTLIAVFIATSDEAIPIMISQPSFIVPMLILIAFKFGFATIYGYVIDFTCKLFRKKDYKPVEAGGEHKHAHNCADNIFLDALKHTLNIALFVFIATFIINMIIFYVGMDSISLWFGKNIFVEILIASLVGLIPNCAASVFLVELFISGALGFPALVAGLSVGAGVGFLVLFNKNRKKMLENIGILVLILVLGLITGFILSPFDFSWIFV